MFHFFFYKVNVFVNFVAFFSFHSVFRWDDKIRKEAKFFFVNQY